MTLRFEQGNAKDAFDIRRAVFVEEQGFSEEFDSIDDTALHITLYLGDICIGCSRTFPYPNRPTQFILGRLAILPEYRGYGYGAQILAQTETYAKAAGARLMHLHAQYHARPFYEKAGYSIFGDRDLDEHVEHIWMEKTLAD
jgi:predicted GNAT family N-acyltransferase